MSIVNKSHVTNHISLKYIFTRNLLVQSQQRKHKKNVKSVQSYGNSLTHGSGDSIADFEQGNANWDISFYSKKQRHLSKAINLQ